jgi:hypothetical protein
VPSKIVIPVVAGSSPVTHPNNAAGRTRLAEYTLSAGESRLCVLVPGRVDAVDVRLITVQLCFLAVGVRHFAVLRGTLEVAYTLALVGAGIPLFGTMVALVSTVIPFPGKAVSLHPAGRSRDRGLVCLRGVGFL